VVMKTHYYGHHLQKGGRHAPGGLISQKRDTILLLFLPTEDMGILTIKKRSKRSYSKCARDLPKLDMESQRERQIGNYHLRC